MLDFSLAAALCDDLRFIGNVIENTLLTEQKDDGMRRSDIAVKNFREDLGSAWADLIFPTGISQGVPFGALEAQAFIFAFAKMEYHARVLGATVLTRRNGDHVHRIRQDWVLVGKIIEYTAPVAERFMEVLRTAETEMDSAY